MTFKIGSEIILFWNESYKSDIRLFSFEKILKHFHNFVHERDPNLYLNNYKTLFAWYIQHLLLIHQELWTIHVRYENIEAYKSLWQTSRKISRWKPLWATFFPVERTNQLRNVFVQILYMTDDYLLFCRDKRAIIEIDCDVWTKVYTNLTDSDLEAFYIAVDRSTVTRINNQRWERSDIENIMF